jgi:hypothetical protein
MDIGEVSFSFGSFKRLERVLSVNYVFGNKPHATSAEYPSRRAAQDTMSPQKSPSSSFAKGGPEAIACSRHRRSSQFTKLTLEGKKGRSQTRLCLKKE